MKKVLICIVLLLMNILFMACGDSSSATSPSDEKNTSGKYRCGGEDYNPQNQFCDERDGRIYKYVTIAPKGSGYSKIWMAENLRYTVSEGCFCEKVFSEDRKKTFNCSKYGMLYTWAAAIGKKESECGYEKECNLDANTIQGVCPKGWHLPSAEDWFALIVAIEGKLVDHIESNKDDDYIEYYIHYKNNNVGNKLKSKEGWVKKSNGSTGNGVDSYGFTALPAGGWDSHGGGYYDDEGYDAYFWSSTESNEHYAYAMTLYFEEDDEGYDAAYVEDMMAKKNANSVRCVKD